MLPFDLIPPNAIGDLLKRRAFSYSGVVVVVVVAAAVAEEEEREREMAKPPKALPLPCEWAVALFLLAALSVTDAQEVSPLASPPLPLQNLPAPVSYSPRAPAPSPEVMQIVVGAQQHRHFRKEFFLPIVLGCTAAAALTISAFFAWFLWRRKRRMLVSKDIESSGRALPFGPTSSKLNSLKIPSKKGLLPALDYASLELATNNFSEANVLGEGGFSQVYKANFCGDGSAAVKKLDGVGQDRGKEFENEIDLLGRIQHPNIISLLGYCVRGESRLLVYELMQNGSLETQLHGPSRGSALTWHIRMKIALDIARGLEYLHEHCNPPVIHRDIKSSNILLDSDYNAKIADFGLAVIGRNHNKGSLKLSGTLGYVAPEYLLDGKLTEKSDVYAFGIILLQLLMGRKPVEKIEESQSQSIVTWAMPQLTDRSKLPNIVDPVLQNKMDLKHLYQVAAVAVLCVQQEPSYRPLITDVLHSLIPLVPTELGGMLRVAEPTPITNQKPLSK